MMGRSRLRPRQAQSGTAALPNSNGRCAPRTALCPASNTNGNNGGQGGGADAPRASADGATSSEPHPVGQKKPNPFGLYDMHGNEREWVQDLWHETYYGAASDSLAWIEGGAEGRRVL